MSRWRDRVAIAGDLLPEPEALRALELLERPPEEWECDRPISPFRSIRLRTFDPATVRITIGGVEITGIREIRYDTATDLSRPSKIPPRPQFNREGYARAEALAKKRRG